MAYIYGYFDYKKLYLKLINHTGNAKRIKKGCLTAFVRQPFDTL